MMRASGSTLGPEVAGRWYPGDPAVLSSRIDSLLGLEQRASPSNTGAAPRVVVAPHAGFDFSGAVAGAAFRPLAGERIDRVVLVGPSHHHAFAGGVLPEATRYETPLGEIPFDLEAVERLGSRPGIERSNTPYLGEHSLEAELPFLQTALVPDWRLVPLLVGGQQPEDALPRVAEAIAPLLVPGTLVVVSSDFTHFGRAFGYLPFDVAAPDVPRRLRELDMGAVECILRGSPEEFRSYVGRTGATICGRDAIAVALLAFGRRLQGRLEAYDNSGRVTGDWTHCVSYAGLTLGTPPTSATH